MFPVLGSFQFLKNQISNPHCTIFFVDDALQKLAIFESKYSRLKDERDNVAKAKEALELQDVSVNVVS